jgi:hypothetical protein
MVHAWHSPVKKLLFLAIVSLLSIFGSAGPAQAPLPGWFTVSRQSLCITEGAVNETAGNRLNINVPKMRAYVNRWTREGIEARFTYLGPTATQAPLGSGEVRQQFGLKLRAQDACNLLYAMWRFGPPSRVVVSVKSNPGEHTSAECGNRGYRNIKPQEVARVAPPVPGETHSLRAELDGAELGVFVDDAPVWKGAVGSEPPAFNGPVGIRSDNVRLKLDLRAGQPRGAHPDYVASCKSDGGE